MMHISVPIEGTSEVISATEISPLVSKCQIKVFYIDNKPNRNGTVITRKVAEKIGQKLPGSPIVGYYNPAAADFEQHNKELKFDSKDETFSLVDTTKPYGFVPTDAKVWFQDFQDDDGVTRRYLCTEGIIWSEAYPEAKRILESGNNQSMELNEKNLEGVWTKDSNSGRRFFIINEAIIEKLCVLGEDYEPCFEGAQIKSEFSLTDEIKNLRQSMYCMIQKMSIEGGLNSPMEENKTLNQEPEAKIVEGPVVEFKAAEEEDKKNSDSQGKTVEEDTSKSEDTTEGTSDEKKKDEPKKEYSLDEIPEYVQLKSDYEALQTSYAALEQEKNSLAEELEPLRTFKLDKEREEKQSMINSFYMLSDEDKKDVVENIDSYSLNDIESKLAVICLHNKVSFAAPAEENSQQLTYSLNSAAEQDVDDAPAWLQAVRQTEKEMN